jgi:quercetin dioxygenase-like cupin family protein
MEPPNTTSSASGGRLEIIQSQGSSKPITLVPGVELRPLIDAQSGATKLFTGLLTLAPGAAYPPYVHSFREALTLLEGEAAVDVEARRYRLRALDTVVVSPRRPRAALNLSPSRPALLHVSVGSSTPDQTWVNARFRPIEQTPDSTGQSGAEQIRRRPPQLPGAAAPQPSVHDLFKSEGGPDGICGCHTTFQAGARLPCHHHKCDESITVIQGSATCVVEGRRHDLPRLTSALIPRGLRHYVINLTLDPMAVILVYAGHEPDQLVVDERFCQAKGTQARRA